MATSLNAGLPPILYRPRRTKKVTADLSKAQMARMIRRALNGHWPHPLESTRHAWRLPAWWVTQRYTRRQLIEVLDDIGFDCAELRR